MNREDSILSGLDPAGLFDLGESPAASQPGGPATSAWEPPAPTHVARLFPRWEILGLLGRGGMGAVYHAYQPDLDRQIAIKLLPIETSADEAFVQRFQREARTLAKLRHPNIVALHEFGTTSEGHPFFVMEYVDGATLAEKIGKLSVPEALEIVRQACDALSHAHSMGIVHRDIKPSNLLLDSSGQIKVADFGLAKWDQPQGPAMTLSRTGGFMGTAEYAAPEQVKDAAHADHRADIYSLGVLFYEMLTGERPRGVFRPPSAKAGSDPRLDPMVLRALQENPGERYQAAADLREELNGLHRRTRLLPWLTGALGVLLIAAVALLFSNQRKAPPVAGKTEDTTPAPVVAEPTSAGPEAPVPPVAVTEPAPLPPTQEEKPAVPTPPVAPVEPEATPVSSAPKPKIFALTPVDPRFYPPGPFLERPWKTFVLTATGGVALTTDQKLLFWDADLKLPREIQAPEPIRQLVRTPEGAVALAESGTIYPLLDPDALKQQPGPRVALLGQSAKANTIPALMEIPAPPDQPIARSSLIFFSTEGFPFSTGSIAPEQVTDLAMLADGSTFLLDREGTLHAKKDHATEVREENIAAIAAGKDHLAYLTKDGKVGILNGPPPPADLGKTLHITAGDGFTLAVQEDGRGVLFFTDPLKKSVRYRLASGTAPVTASPAGLLVSQ